MIHIKNFIEKSKGLSLAITGDNEFYLEKTTLTLVKDLTNNEIDKFLIINPKNSSNIKIEDIKNLQEFLSFRPDNGKKLVVLFNAEKLMPEAENALLKTLEEPPEYGIIILVTTSWNSLFQTIRSRVFRFYISIPKEQFKDVSDPFLQKLIWTFPDKIEEIKNRNFDLIEISQLMKEKNKLNVYYTLYTKIKESLGDYKKINELVKVLSKLRDPKEPNKNFEMLKIVGKISLWIAEEFSNEFEIKYSHIKNIEKIVSSKVPNYLYDLTYYFILLSLNDSISKN
ncbi:MAG: hypothetical protein H0Z24_07930 [Thermosipho sp. (in: Bacteria)]|nr:hypothetical protein [Thermosipho sp. (in: thermotogales)]